MNIWPYYKQNREEFRTLKGKQNDFLSWNRLLAKSDQVSIFMDDDSSLIYVLQHRLENGKDVIYATKDLNLFMNHNFKKRKIIYSMIF